MNVLFNKTTTQNGKPGPGSKPLTGIDLQSLAFHHVPANWSSRHDGTATTHRSSLVPTSNITLGWTPFSSPVWGIVPPVLTIRIIITYSGQLSKHQRRKNASRKDTPTQASGNKPSAQPFATRRKAHKDKFIIHNNKSILHPKTRAVCCQNRDGRCCPGCSAIMHDRHFRKVNQPTAMTTEGERVLITFVFILPFLLPPVLCIIHFITIIINSNRRSTTAAAAAAVVVVAATTVTAATLLGSGITATCSFLTWFFSFSIAALIAFSTLPAQSSSTSSSSMGRTQTGWIGMRSLLEAGGSGSSGLRLGGAGSLVLGVIDASITGGSSLGGSRFTGASVFCTDTLETVSVKSSSSISPSSISPSSSEWTAAARIDQWTTADLATAHIAACGTRLATTSARLSPAVSRDEATRPGRSPTTNANQVRARIFVHGNRAGRCHWSEGFLGDILFPTPSTGKGMGDQSNERFVYKFHCVSTGKLSCARTRVGVRFQARLVTARAACQGHITIPIPSLTRIRRTHLLRIVIVSWIFLSALVCYSNPSNVIQLFTSCTRMAALAPFELGAASTISGGAFTSPRAPADRNRRRLDTRKPEVARSATQRNNSVLEVVAIDLEEGVQTTPKVVKGTGENMLRDGIDSPWRRVFRACLISKVVLATSQHCKSPIADLSTLPTVNDMNSCQTIIMNCANVANITSPFPNHDAIFPCNIFSFRSAKTLAKCSPPSVPHTAIFPWVIFSFRFLLLRRSPLHVASILLFFLIEQASQLIVRRK
ncbi:hypothetical protein PR048_008602 [Dryococelus australis]|uniref:Uncharacterized protein n=1 Tax=Dryococelus australis TaxID=614101 RepID=A0ABQ9HXK1_9NEOP|nr:hypothetical protein PR048_008602 [Dryococelus australis]